MAETFIHDDVRHSTNTALDVNIIGGSVGASTADGSAFTNDTTSGTIAMGVYKTVADTIANGEAAAVAIDASRNLKVTLATLVAGEDITNNVMQIVRKPLPVATYSPSVTANFGTDADVSVKATAGNVFAVTASNVNAAVRYLQLHNKASAPANPDVPIYSFPIPAGSATNPVSVTMDERFFGQAGKHFTTGIAIGISTTNATYTAATAADHNHHTHYV